MGKTKVRRVKLKPVVICLSSDYDEYFRWMSDGYGPGSDLFAQVQQCIEDGDDVPHVIRLLKKAGFSVVRGD